MGKPQVVADIMTTSVITLSEEDNLLEIEEDMESFGLRHLPVVDGDKLVGLISHRDILKLALSPLIANRTTKHAIEERQAETFVADVMTMNPITCTPQTPLADAARLLTKGRFGCVPVVQDDKLVGIVTEHDFVVKMLFPDSE